MSTTLDVVMCFAGFVVSFLFGAWSNTNEGDSLRVKTVKCILAFLSLLAGIIFTALSALLVHGGEFISINATQAFFLLIAGFIPGWLGLAASICLRNRASSKKDTGVIQSESSTPASE